ncbi:hypothetical protein, partial [Phenylobacterium sp.]|uniref:hypothetical protein n=1 Tax=Phenylobacterium sp. TaxID=1871053 RepID=UPI00391CFFFB
HQRIHKAELTRPLHRHHRSPCNTIRESRHGNYAKVPLREKEHRGERRKLPLKNQRSAANRPPDHRPISRLPAVGIIIDR